KTPDGFDAPMALAFSRAANESLVVPVATELGGSAELTAAVRQVLQEDRSFIAYDAKAVFRRLAAAALPVPSRWADPMIMSYVINPGLPSHAMGNVARDRLKQDVL